MKTIKITKAFKATKGHYLHTQECNYYSNSENEPTIEGEWWSCSLFGFSKKEALNIPNRATKFSLLTAEQTLDHLKSFSSSKKAVGSSPSPLLNLGLLAVNISTGALRAAGENAAGIKGFVLCYRNSEDESAMLIAVAGSEIVDEIQKSLRPEIVVPL